MKATGILLEQLARFRRDDWAYVLALVKERPRWAYGYTSTSGCKVISLIDATFSRLSACSYRFV